MQAVEMGENYIEQMMENSLIYEEEYVNPKDAIIFFPKGKRNLILIYLESMETTYSSVAEGGAKPMDYILELTQLAKDNTFFSDDEDFGGASSVSGISTNGNPFNFALLTVDTHHPNGYVCSNCKGGVSAAIRKHLGLL